MNVRHTYWAPFDQVTEALHAIELTLFLWHIPEGVAGIIMYADDLVVVSASVYHLQLMIDICWVNHFSIGYLTLPVILAVNSCFTRYYGYEPYLRLFSFQWKRRSYICISAIFRYQRMFPFPMPEWWTLLWGRQYVHMHLQIRIHWAELWNRYNWDFISDFLLLYLQICEIEWSNHVSVLFQKASETFLFRTQWVFMQFMQFHLSFI